MPESEAPCSRARKLILACMGIEQVKKRTVPIFFDNSRLEDYWILLQQMGPFRQWFVLMMILFRAPSQRQRKVSFTSSKGELNNLTLACMESLGIHMHANLCHSVYMLH
jgi:hypothetical protein